MMRYARTGVVVAILALFHTGCATFPYVMTRDVETDKTLHLVPGEPQVERGTSKPGLDRAANIWAIPRKCMYWDSRVDSHAVTPGTELLVLSYLRSNGIENVKINVNRHAPGEQWRRLKANREVGWFWRYTLGAAMVTKYTLFSERFFGGDNYNPFTNTLNLYSDNPALALKEASAAKAFNKAKHKNLLIPVGLIPMGSLLGGVFGISEASGYAKKMEDQELKRSIYKTLYPEYCTNLGNEAIGWFIPNPLLKPAVNSGMNFVAPLPGHGVGRALAKTVEPTVAVPLKPCPYR